MEITAKNILTKDIKQKIQNNEDIVLIDTLSKESFCYKHIPGSINIPTDEIEKYAEIVLPDKKQNLIVYCKNPLCQKSVKAVEVLIELGYEEVLHYQDGLDGWQNEGNKLVTRSGEVHDEC